MPTFSTDFEPPPTLTGLSVLADVEASAVRLEWDPSNLPPEDFDRYRVYRSVAGGAWVVLAEYVTTTELSHDDFTAPIGVEIGYRVTQASLDFESAPAEGSTILDSRMWWVVSPDDETLTFAIPKVRSAPVTSSKVQDVYAPVGRPTRVVVGDVVQAESGRISFLVMPDNPGMVALLKRAQARMEGTLLLKAPDGVVHQVRLGDMTRSLTNVQGLQELTLEFIGAG